ncbi:MAG: helix-turn-helix domain-containing protein [Coriobacteriia bacterium]
MHKTTSITVGSEQSLAALPSDPLVLTVAEVAQVLRISRGVAYEAVRNGSIPSIRIGRRVLVAKRTVEHMLGTGLEGCKS